MSRLTADAGKGILWGGFGLCTAAFVCRIAIRVICFRRLFVEDYLMLAALILLLVTTTLSQLFAQSIYGLDNVSNGATPTPSNLEETSMDLRIFTALTVLSYVGIWLVKLNFLLFFRRLGNHVPKYRITWWFVLAFNLAAGATAIGLVNYKYTISPTDLVFATYTSIETVRATYIGFTVSCSLDAMGDALSE